MIPVLSLRAGAAASVQRGHPWVYREQIEKAPKLASGDFVRVAHGGIVLGCGVWSASSPLAVRVWTQGEAPPDVLARRLDRALDARDALFYDGATTAFRCLHGEGDRTPGFVVDRYGPVAIVRVDGDGARARLGWFAEELWPKLRERGVTSLAHRDHATGATELISGEAPPESIVVREHGVPMQVDLARGQKTGAFLDQRENRRRVGARARGKRVLNLFSYAGGFSLHAALGGATHTTSVDVAAHAHSAAQASFKLADVDPRAHAFVTADAFAFLEKARERGERWDLIVSDPPSFAPKEQAKKTAIGAYKKLHRACAAVLAEGGTFCASSCSSHVTPEDFLSTLDDAAIARGDLSVRELHGAPADHPILAGWPEGRYLKFAILS